MLDSIRGEQFKVFINLLYFLVFYVYYIFVFNFNSLKCIIYLLTVENESHCDFVKLREMLIRTNMEDLREKTHEKHYELYRKMRLEQVKF